MPESDHNVDRILAAVRELLTERGVGQISYRAIAQKTGLSAGTVAYYFPSRDELLETVLDHHHDEFAELLQPLLAMPLATLRQLGGIRRLLEFGFARRADVRLRLATWMARWTMTDRRRDVLGGLLGSAAEVTRADGGWSDAERRIALQALVFAAQRFIASSDEDLCVIASAETPEEARTRIVDTIDRMFDALFPADADVPKE